MLIRILFLFSLFFSGLNLFGQDVPFDFDASIDLLCRQIARPFQEGKKIPVSLVEFTSINGAKSSLGSFLSEEMTMRLYRSNKFTILERRLLGKVLLEQKFENSNVADPESYKRLGKLLGVEAIITGTITEMGDEFRINARVISTISGELFSTASCTIDKDRQICEIIGIPIPGSRAINLYPLRPEAALSTSVPLPRNQGMKIRPVEVRDFFFEIVDIVEQNDDVFRVEMLAINRDRQRRDVELTIGQVMFDRETFLTTRGDRTVGLSHIYIGGLWDGQKRSIKHNFIYGKETRFYIVFKRQNIRIEDLYMLSIAAHRPPERETLRTGFLDSLSRGLAKVSSKKAQDCFDIRFHLGR